MTADMASSATSPPKTPLRLDTGADIAKIAVVGSIHMDFINFVDSHPPLGGHVQAKEVIHAPGGHGINQAVACARLSKLPREFLSHEGPHSTKLLRSHSGLEVFMIGAVGDQDTYGNDIKAELKKNKVNTDGIATIKGQRTGYAHVHVNAGGQSTVTFSPGASSNFLPGPLFDPKFAPDVVLVQLEIPLELTLHALTWAKEHNAMTICNAAPPTRSVPHEIFKVDHVIVNEQSADRLNGFDEKLFKDQARINQRDQIRQHYQELCEMFHDNGAVCVVITMAELGAVGSRRDPASGVRQQYIFDAEQGENLPVKDTTGASDAFIGGYTVELMHQKQAGIRQDMASAMRLGIKAAGLCVSRAGSMHAIPTPKEIMETTFRAAVARDC